MYISTQKYAMYKYYAINTCKLHLNQIVTKFKLNIKIVIVSFLFS